MGLKAGFQLNNVLVLLQTNDHYKECKSESEMIKLHSSPHFGLTMGKIRAYKIAACVALNCRALKKKKKELL